MHSRESVLYHDLLYHFQDFQKEAQIIQNLIKSNLPKAKTILDVACGPHEHVKTLKKNFSVDGVDINSDFFPIAKQKNPNGSYIQASMSNFHINKTYDAIICLSSSIGYVNSVAELNATIACFSKHLNQKGIIIVVPWFTPDNWSPDKISIVSRDLPDIKIARVSLRKNEGRKSIMHFSYAIATPKKITNFCEDHNLYLFSKQEMFNAFRLSNLLVSFEEGWAAKRGLYIAKNF